MKIFLILLFAISLFAFDGKKLYKCVSKYRIVNGSPHEFTLEEQEKSIFSLVFNKSLTKVKTADGLIYKKTSSNLKGKLYMTKLKANGRDLTYKLRVASANGLYRSVSVTGYGNLINEYVLCQKVETSKKNTDKNVTKSKTHIN